MKMTTIASTGKFTNGKGEERVFGRNGAGVTFFWNGEEPLKKGDVILYEEQVSKKGYNEKGELVDLDEKDWSTNNIVLSVHASKEAALEFKLEDVLNENEEATFLKGRGIVRKEITNAAQSVPAL